MGANIMTSLESSSTVASAAITSAGAILTMIEQVDYPAGEFVDAPGENYVLCLIKKGCGEIRSRFARGRQTAQKFRSGMFVPITMPDTRAEFSMGAPMRHLVVTLHPSTFGCWVEDRGPTVLGTIPRLQERGFRDPLLEQIVCAIWSEAQSGRETGDLFGDALRLALTGAILRKAGDGAHNHGHPAKRMSDIQLSRATDFLRNNFSQKILLADVSSLIDMQERTFSAAFKRTTGQTPYQYLLDLRIERARSLLISSSTPISGIAHETGFADQAHLTAAFTRRIGVPPAHYRRSSRQ
jgi:AraC family transcriptional regulator